MNIMARKIGDPNLWQLYRNVPSEEGTVEDEVVQIAMPAAIDTTEGVLSYYNSIKHTLEPGYVAPLTIDDFRDAIQRRLDTKARERHYDGIQTGITYRDDPNPQYAAEGAALFAWRSAVWTYVFAELAKVTAAERAPPTIEDFINELPALSWPEDENVE